MAAVRFETYWRTQRSYHSHPTPDLRPYLANFQTVANLDQFGEALTLLINEGTRLPGNNNKGRISELLTAFWNTRCLVFPRNGGAFIGRLHGGHVYWGETGTDPHPGNILDQFRAISKGHQKTTVIQVRLLIRLMLSIGDVQEPGDLTPEVLGGRLVGHKLAPSLCSTLVSVMRARHGALLVNFTANEYGPFGKQGIFSDDNFGWAVEQDPVLEQWRTLCAEWMGIQTRNIREAKRSQLVPQVSCQAPCHTKNPKTVPGHRVRYRPAISECDQAFVVEEVGRVVSGLGSFNALRRGRR